MRIDGETGGCYIDCSRYWRIIIASPWYFTVDSLVESLLANHYCNCMFIITIYFYVCNYNKLCIYLYILLSTVHCYFLSHSATRLHLFYSHYLDNIPQLIPLCIALRASHHLHFANNLQNPPTGSMTWWRLARPGTRCSPAKAIWWSRRTLNNNICLWLVKRERGRTSLQLMKKIHTV